MWALFVTVIMKLMYCLVLGCVVALLACIPLLIVLPHQDVHAEIVTVWEVKPSSTVTPEWYPFNHHHYHLLNGIEQMPNTEIFNGPMHFYLNIISFYG
jgi:hypothetical protein